jgi:chaperone required for assembly of F1-ATPase
MKRFWKTVTTENGAILLDGRMVKTPARTALTLPTPALADGVADEWRAVGDTVDPRAMPLTGLANAAIDRPVEATALAAYAETDCLCYRAAEPLDLAARQAAIWDPMLEWARVRFDIAFAVTTGIIHKAQPPETVRRLGAAVAAYDDFHRTALSPLVTIGGSLVAALMLAEGAITHDAAFDACYLDEYWQAEKWGEDWMATDARNARRADFMAAARFLSLL